MQQPHLAPNLMVVHRLVYEAVGNDVETVIVDGNVVMENRKVRTVSEMDILHAAQEEALANIERAGLQPYMHDPGWMRTRRTFDEAVAFQEG
jgi:hypothetical protein